MRGKTWNEEESVTEFRCERSVFTRQWHRCVVIGAKRHALWRHWLQRVAYINALEHVHVREYPIQLGDQRGYGGIVDAEARKQCDVPHVVI